MSPDLKELLALLLSHEVRFLISGGHALAVHGHPRYTKDLDFWLANDRSNLEKARDAIEAFGFGAVGDDLMSLEHGRAMLQLGREPNRVGLLNFATGLKFESAWSNRIQAEFEGLRLSFLGLEDFKTNKRATGRLGDLADLERLGEIVDAAEAAAAATRGKNKTD